MARDVYVFVLPGADVARARVLDLAAAGLRPVDTPRHAGLLLIAGPLPPDLRDAACVVYAEMPRPRAILALGAGDLGALPQADASGPLSPSGLAQGIAAVRTAIAAGAFGARAEDFDAPVLSTRIEYTCPMHPEVVSDKTGKCPKCGMFLVEREVSGAAHKGHDRSADAQPAPADHGHKAHDHSAHDASADAASYVCPMHPEVVSAQPGSCPKCGMDLVPAGDGDAHADEGDEAHGEHKAQNGGRHGGHSGHGGGAQPPGVEPHFMSMVDLTEGKPASPDGLIMEWITVPFGPAFPGLPGGLGLEFTLDGDSVAETRIRGTGAVPVPPRSPVAELADRMAEACPLAPVAMRELACRAIEAAAGVGPDATTMTARAAAVERERIASHLNWLAGFAHQTGLTTMERRAARLQHRVRGAGAEDVGHEASAIRGFLARVRATPLLRLKLARIGTLDSAPGGPVARAARHAVDARRDDVAYKSLGFETLVGDGGDALARLRQRCAEIAQSLDLIGRARTIAMPDVTPDADANGHGMATIETPRGPATLHLSLKDGLVETADLIVPFVALAGLVPAMVAQMEVADALVAIGSLDLDPWGGAS